MDPLSIATLWLGGCSGCHMSFLDLDEWLIDFAGQVELVYSPIIDLKEYPEKVDVALVEGAVANEDNRLRAKAGINKLQGVGVSEAPRGTLFHHYQVNENGLIQKVNLVIATGQNNLAIGRTVAKIARHFVQGNRLTEGMLNRVEAGVRAFDPCLSCSTHAAGIMPLKLTLKATNGVVLDEIVRK